MESEEKKVYPTIIMDHFGFKYIYSSGEYVTFDEDGSPTILPLSEYDANPDQYLIIE